MIQAYGAAPNELAAPDELRMSGAMRFKRGLKSAVRLLQRTLPRRVFDMMYDAAFPAYKATVRFGYLVSGTVLHSWRDREAWQMVRDVHRVMPRTLVGVGGLEATYSLARGAMKRGIKGDLVELGVARGGCAALLATALFERNSREQARRLWLFDSYEGLPEPGPQDFGADNTTGDHVRPLPKGSCLGTLEDVQGYLLKTRGFPSSRVEFVKGWFQDTVPVERQRIESIAVLRIDGDWYDSTKVCLEGLYDRVSSGGAIIIDDYQSCYGAQKAVDEFIHDRQLKVDIRLDGRGGCWFLKV